jgi:hypothetical protein
MNNLTTAFFGIEKADRNPDGTLTVYGKATDDAIDIDQQICDADWLERAMPDWFKSGGNIREQHSNIAAGVATEYEQKGTGHFVTALVVDPVSAKKVETGVLKGFSVGIKNPRVVRDNKAANGRIIDGQIVEVSLVDRPANPNCQLVLAKSVSGVESLVQVEDLIETNELLLDTQSLKGANMKRAQEILDLAKGHVAPEAVKFDKATYDKARQALAQLIAVEAKEMEEGADEQASLAHLLEAVHHLFAWYQNEIAEGEVMEEIELAASKDDAAKEMKPKKGETKDDFMKRCKEAGMEDDAAEKCWSKYGKMEHKEDEAEKSANKCLECGCHQPENTHGLTQLPNGTNVSTADIVSPAETPKSAEADEPATEEVAEENKDEVSADEKPADLEAIVEEVVDKATKALKSEIANLVSAKEAAENKAIALESELAHAKSLAVAGGPKRTAKADQSNDLIAKAATYKAKANATTDPTLAKGYRALADKFYAEANATLNK